ncbi:MAG TPA: hypothetical protein VMF11_11625 [Candidatus Baltobacteraceae bacterium]|nr:hypothetical protein [Candidatus Baltobacteraceae bacterium]
MAQADRRRALVIGVEHDGRKLCRLINERSGRWYLRYRGSSRVQTLLALIESRSVEAVISLSGPGPHAALADVARRRNIPVIVIWAGAEVLAAKTDPHLLEVIKNYKFINLADSPWLVDELRALGIDASYLPVTAVDVPATTAPMPERFNVLAYLPEPQRPFYGERAIYQIASEFPDVPFTVTGRGAPNGAAPPNVRFAGHVDDIAERIDASSVLLRMRKHDGKSQLVLEALAHARHVIWNHDFPGVAHASNTAHAIRLVRALRNAHEAGMLDANEGGREYVAERFAPERIAADFENLLDRAVRERPLPHDASRRVAISGLELFTAQVVREVERRSNGWLAEPLRVRGRLEVASSMISLANADVWYSIGAPIGDRWLHLLARLLRKPRVIHWVGTDITALRSNKRLRRWCTSAHVQNLAEAPWTIAELRALGIEAKLAPLPPRLPRVERVALPSTFTVLFYLPKSRAEFYGRREYERLIRAFAPRNVRFFLVGGGEYYAPPGANIVALGWQTSLEHIYPETTVLIRFTQRDGLSLMTLEALAYGRHVLWTQEFPFVTRVNRYEEIERALNLLLEAHERGELRAQDDAARYISRAYSAEQCISEIAAVWETAARRPKRAKPLARPAS